ncbi:hypothetical protein C0J52_18068 [Blattella germanica]|nr:hypothetical protein C0J52_18068 [Blattella germanica]
MADETEVSSNTFTFKKRNIRNKASRKRHASDDEEKSSEDETTVIKKEKRAHKANPMVQKTNTSRKSSTVETRDGSSEDEVSVSYKSKRTTNREGPSDMGATAILEIETEVDKDAQAIFENALKINKSTRCYICNQQTQGVFNPAKEIIARIKGDEGNGGGDATELPDNDSDSD